MIDVNERAFTELADHYVVRHGRVEGMLKMASDLMVYERDLTAAEREIDRLQRQISAGYTRTDVSSHYGANWTPKAPLADAVTDEWLQTGREAA